MSDLMFSSVFGTADSLVSSVSASSFLLCSVVSIVLGLVIAGVYMFRHRYSKNFVVTLALLPLIVQMVITLVNGNLGAGIAVMGVFNLVRFRSIPGSAKDIGSVFLAMAVGLATGMGFLGLAVLFTAIIAVVNVVYVLSPLGRPHEAEKTLKIVVPEDSGIRRHLRRRARSFRRRARAHRSDHVEHGEPLHAGVHAAPSCSPAWRNA